MCLYFTSDNYIIQFIYHNKHFVLVLRPWQEFGFVLKFYRRLESIKLTDLSAWDTVYGRMHALHV